jgi:hypothetical protein
MISNTWLIASSKERGFHILAGISICLVGLIVVSTVENTGGRYAALCILTFGSYVSAPLTAAWLSGNTPGKLPAKTGS